MYGCPTSNSLEAVNMPILIGHKDAFNIIQHILNQSIKKKQEGEAEVTSKAISKGSQKISYDLKRKPTSEQLKWLLCWKGTKIPSW